jgi:CheY-like chemotaxis protein
LRSVAQRTTMRAKVRRAGSSRVRRNWVSEFPLIWRLTFKNPGAEFACRIFKTPFCNFSKMETLIYPPNGRILVVDDNALALDAMSELLEFEGFSVLTAQNGSDALHQMRTAGRISLVLLDLWMPVMDGWEFLRRKASDAGIAKIPVVVLSAVPPVSLDGADEILRKPIDPGLFVDTVRRLSK